MINLLGQNDNLILHKIKSMSIIRRKIQPFLAYTKTKRGPYHRDSRQEFAKVDEISPILHV